MLEIVTDAIVLDKNDAGDYDSRVFLYTKELGKITARVKSVRKITSKLAGHIEPLSVISARIIDKNGPQLVDALKSGRMPKSQNLLKILLLVKELAAEGQKDITLWNFLEKTMNNGFEVKNMAEVLSLLGFDPTFAKCSRCKAGKPQKFSVSETAFFCKNCFAN